MSKPEDDAEGQYAPSQADRNADGVHSAKPTVITGSEDATVNNTPPGQKKPMDFDLNYDERTATKEAFADKFAFASLTGPSQSALTEALMRGLGYCINPCQDN